MNKLSSKHRTDLNSIILEGIISDKPKTADGITTFHILSMRHERTEMGFEVHIPMTTRIAATGYGASAAVEAGRGMRVRVVGRLASWKSFYVHAEHVEVARDQSGVEVAL